jgi:hypothetical protein
VRRPLSNVYVQYTLTIAYRYAGGQGSSATRRRAAKNPVNAFINPEGYRLYIDTAETDLRNGVVH